MSFNPKYLLPEDKREEDEINDSIEKRFQFIQNLAERNKTEHMDRMKVLEEQLKKNKENCNEKYDEVEKIGESSVKMTDLDKLILPFYNNAPKDYINQYRESRFRTDKIDQLKDKIEMQKVLLSRRKEYTGNFNEDSLSLSVPNIRNHYRIIKDEVYARIIEPALEKILLPRKTQSEIDEEKRARDAYGDILDTQIKEFYKDQLAIFIVNKLIKKTTELRVNTILTKIKAESDDAFENSRKYIVEGGTWNSWRIQVDISPDLLLKTYQEIMKERRRYDYDTYHNEPNTTRLFPFNHTLALVERKRAEKYNKSLDKMSYQVFSDSFIERDDAEIAFRNKVENDLGIDLDKLLRVKLIDINITDLGAHCLINFKEYMQLERYYMTKWQYIKSPEKLKLPINTGVTCFAFSNHNMLAAGTSHGSIYIYGIQYHNIHLLYEISEKSFFSRFFDTPVIHMAWSNDTTSRLLVTNKKYITNLYALNKPPDKNKQKKSKKEKDGNDSGNGYKHSGLFLSNKSKPLVPTLLATLDTKTVQRGDITIASQLGMIDYEEGMSLRYGISYAVFHPSIDFWGIQHSIMLALNSGVILKYNLSPNENPPEIINKHVPKVEPENPIDPVVERIFKKEDEEEDKKNEEEKKGIFARLLGKGKKKDDKEDKDKNKKKDDKKDGEKKDEEKPNEEEGEKKEEEKKEEGEKPKEKENDDKKKKEDIKDKEKDKDKDKEKSNEVEKKRQEEIKDKEVEKSNNEKEEKERDKEEIKNNEEGENEKKKEEKGSNKESQNGVIHREYFQGHLRRVILISFVENLTTKMVSVDESGIISMWTYDELHFSGYNWFVPHNKYKLKLEYKVYVPYPRSRIEVLIRKPDVITSKKESEEFVQKSYEVFHNLQENHNLVVFNVTEGDDEVFEYSCVDEATEEMSKNDQSLIMVDLYTIKLHRGILIEARRMKGLPVNTKGKFLSAEVTPCVKFFVFDLIKEELSPFSAEAKVDGKLPPKFAVSSIKDSTGSDYIFLLIDNSVRVISLTSGIIVIGANYPLRENERVELTTIACQSIPTRVAIGSPYSKEFYIYNIIDENAKKTSEYFLEFLRPRVENVRVENRDRFEHYVEENENDHIVAKKAVMKILDLAYTNRKEREKQMK